MKIRGNVTATTIKRPDFNQTDPKKSDYIKNNPIPRVTASDNGKFLRVKGGKWECVDISLDVDTGVVQTIETINGHALKFFVGTQAEYEALTDNQKQGLFAIISDDANKEAIMNAIAANTAAINENKSAIEGHTTAINTNSKKISSAEGEISNINSNAQSLQNQISDLQNRSAAAEGDIGRLQDYVLWLEQECFSRFTANIPQFPKPSL